MKIILVLLGLLYLLSPYDLVPDMLVGLGWLDDIIVLGLLWRYFYTRGRKRYSYKDYNRENRQPFGERGDKGYYEEKVSGADSQPGEKVAVKDPYTILDVATGASQKEIKIAYRKLAIRYHPDKVLHLGEEFKEMAEKRFKEIQKAYEELVIKK